MLLQKEGGGGGARGSSGGRVLEARDSGRLSAYKSKSRPPLSIRVTIHATLAPSGLVRRALVQPTMVSKSFMLL